MQIITEIDSNFIETLKRNQTAPAIPDTVMSATEISCKVYKPRTYDEAISDPIYGRQWREALEEELQNLEQHNTWEYDKLPSGRIEIGSK